jgi:23S rRNA pseudouridine2605 synthase
VYWIVHKPRGVLTTARDTHGRDTVLGLVPDCGARLFPVGRLDRDTEGLVLLTNDGALAHALLHPSHGVEREYVVSVRGHVRNATFQRLARGVELEEGRTAPAGVDRVQRDAKARVTRFHLTLIEGRKRQIRRRRASCRRGSGRPCSARPGPRRAVAEPARRRAARAPTARFA